MWGKWRLAAAVAVACGWLVMPPVSASHGAVSRGSEATDGSDADGASFNPIVAAGGRYVAFDSTAPDLVAGDTNAVRDVFVRDVLRRTTVLVSRATDGSLGNDSSGAGQNLAAPNGTSNPPAISADGRIVVFDSLATNLVAGDTNGHRDVFVHDRDDDGDGVLDEAGAVATTRVSLSTAGVQSNAESLYPAVSADGQIVSFTSSASSLVTGDSNGFRDVFVHERATGRTVRVSLSSTGSQGNAHSVWSTLSPDGRYVAFFSSATTFVGGDTNGTDDVFLRDRDADGNGVFDEVGAVSTRRVSVSSAGGQGNSHSYYALVSDDGRLVAFESLASNLVPGDTNARADIFVRDVQAGTTTRVSLSSSNGQGNGASSRPRLSADGSRLVFDSAATNLVADDVNGHDDVFLRDLTTGETGLVSLSTTGTAGNGPSRRAGFSADGAVVAFDSAATNLVSGDGNGMPDVFVTVRCPSGATEEGPLSGPVHESVEPAGPPIATDLVHTLNCEVVVPLGL